MAQKNVFKACLAEKDISPEKPGLLMLGWGKNVARGVLNALKVKVLVLSAGNTKAAIVTADQIGTNEARAETVRHAVAKKIGCPADNIIFSATHCHLSILGAIPGNEESEKVAKDYDDKITEGFISAIEEADRNLTNAEIASGQAVLKETVGKCRRMQLSNGAAQTCWGAGALAMPGVKFVGPTASHPKQIDFVCLRQPGEDKPFAIFTTYSSHIHLFQIPYVDSETGGAFQRELEVSLPGVIAMHAFANGGNTDMNEAYPRPDKQNEKALMAWYNKSLKKLSKRFADVVIKALPELDYSKPDQITHACLREKMTGMRRIRERRPSSSKLVLHALAMGDIGIVNMPGEFFHEYYDMLQNQSPFKNLLITGHNECRMGYIGSLLSYEKGGYEIKGTVPLNEEHARELKKQKLKIVASRPDTGSNVVNKLVGLMKQVQNS